jgi:hypothetical protein
VKVLESAEEKFGAEGQKMVGDALCEIGLDIGHQILAGVEIPDDMSEAEFFSFYATVINTIVYASLEDPRIDDEGKVTFDIIWCPHQDHYKAFDCRIQRYLVRGMVQAAQEHALGKGWQVRFDSTIPAGAKTCHFTLWNGTEQEAAEWNRYSDLLEAKALTRKRH